MTVRAGGMARSMLFSCVPLLCCGALLFCLIAQRRSGVPVSIDAIGFAFITSPPVVFELIRLFDR